MRYSCFCGVHKAQTCLLLRLLTARLKLTTVQEKDPRLDAVVGLCHNLFTVLHCNVPVVPGRQSPQAAQL